MTTIDINALALVLAQAAEAEIRPRFRALAKGDLRTQADANDLVTAADAAADRFISREVKAQFPGVLFVGEESVAAAGSGLLPALRDQKAEVDDLFDQMFPNVVQRSASITNAQGWAGGRAAAELAQLGSFEKLG